jgi:hypothetical protein
MNTAHINYPSEEILGDAYVPELKKEFTKQALTRSVPQSRYETALDDDVEIGRLYTRIVTDVKDIAPLPEFEAFTIAPTGTTMNTAALLEYGITTITSGSASQLAVQLPQPVTGQRLVLVNTGTSYVLVYPSNPGGTINNLGPSEPLVLLNDGQEYEFVCVKNPTPGAWVITAPAIAQYDSGEITVPSITPASGLNTIIAVDSSNNGLTQSLATANSWAEDGLNKPEVIVSLLNGQTFYIYKPLIPWNAITKLKIYTNLADTQNLAGSSAVTARLMYVGGRTQYIAGSTRTEDMVQSDSIGGGAMVGPLAPPFGGSFPVNSSIGVSGLPHADTSLPVGASGTRFTEVDFGFAYAQILTANRVGTFYEGQLPNFDPGANQTVLYDTYYTGVIYLGVFLQNFQNLTLTNFKLRFFIEYM